MSLQLNNAEGQANGTTVTTGTTATGGSTASQVLGAAGVSTITHATSSPLQGLASYLFTYGGNLQQFIAWQDGAASALFALRFNFMLTGYPTSDHLFAEWRSTGASLGGLTIGTGGAFRCNIGSGSTSSAGTLPLNTNLRFEAQSSTFGVASTANLSYQVYLDDTETSPLYSLTTPNGTSSAQVQLTRLGRPASGGSTSAMPTFRIDNFAMFIGDATPLGPAEPQKSASDSSLFSENLSSILQGRTVIDLASFSDPSPALAAGSPVSDTASLSESATETASDDGTDLSTLSEVSSLGLAASLTDSATQSEGLTGLALLSAVTDTFSLAESSSLFQGLNVAATDATTMTEVANLAQDTALTDSAIQSDSSALTVTFTVTDSSTFTEGTTGLNQGFVASDSATQTENTTTIAITSVVVDSAVQDDTSTLDNNPFFSVTDTASQTENASTIAAAPSVTDTATQTEGATVVVVSLDRTDSAAQSDSNGAMDWSTPVADIGNLSDSSSLFSGADPTAAETHTLGELVSIAQTSSLVDSATQSESALPAATFTASDLANLSEVSLLEITILANDSSTFLDETTKEQLFDVVVEDTFNLNTEFAYVVESDADESEFSRIQMQFPNLNPITRIDLRG